MMAKIIAVNIFSGSCIRLQDDENKKNVFYKETLPALIIQLKITKVHH